MLLEVFSQESLPARRREYVYQVYMYTRYQYIIARPFLCALPPPSIGYHDPPSGPDSAEVFFANLDA